MAEGFRTRLRQNICTREGKIKVYNVVTLIKEHNCYRNSCLRQLRCVRNKHGKDCSISRRNNHHLQIRHFQQS